MKKEREEKKNKEEATIVTKESFCTVCATFCFLALLMLCTGSLIFGEGGRWVQAFLTGLFGYLAYPAALGGIYLGITGLLGKKLVKNRKLGWCIALSLLFATLIVHSAVTYSWGQQGYIARCFESGENFPQTAPCGVLGGLLVFAFSAIFSKVGGIVALSVLTLCCGYFCYLAAKKPTAPSVVTGKGTDGLISVEDIPVATVVEEEPRQVRSAQSLPTTPTVAQRPGVSLGEGEFQQEQATSQGFSPFGVPDGATQEGGQTAYSREMLFGGTPADNFRTNLLFDPNSKVNQPRAVTPAPTVAPTQPTQSSYTPSYTSAFENSVGETEQSVRPAFILNDRAQEESMTPQATDTQAAPAWQPTPSAPVAESTPVETEYERPAPVDEPSLDRTVATSVEEETEPSQPTPTEETAAPQEQEEYRRHDYMDLFSPSNPNVFGNNEESARYGREFADRALENGRATHEERVEQEEREGRSRDGLHLLDDEEDDPYTLRSNFNVEREVERGDRSVAEGRDRDAELFDRNDGLDTDGRESRARAFEEENTRMAEPTRGIPSQPTPPQPVSQPTPPPKPRVIRPYVRPSLDDFDCRDIEPTANSEEVEWTKENIIATLEEFKITGASIASVSFGPTVTRYNVTIPRNISPKKVVALESPIGISLHAKGVNIYPNYEDGVVSIEVPNKDRQFVQLGCMLSGDTFVNSKPGSLMFAMGKDVANRKVYGDISKMIHMLVAGSSGSGKSVFLGALITSLVYKYSPEELRLILIDPKKTEFVLYNNLPHLMINEIITDAGKAVQCLNWAIGEMNRRYSLIEAMSRSGKYVVNIDDYNAQLEKSQRLPKIVIIIDELADLMLKAKKEMEDRIQNITQKARAAGIHMIVATQRPSTDVITGVIKSNLATRIGFYVASDVDSRVILDQTGAQKLLGKGDLLYTMHGVNVPVRVQSAFIAPEESQRIINFIKNNNEAYYDEEAAAFINSRGGNGGDPMDGSADGEIDPMYIEALRFVIQTNSASISMIQRKCSAGYNRAGKIIEWMEDMGYISPFDGAKARKVLITKEEFESKYGPL